MKIDMQAGLDEFEKNVLVQLSNSELKYEDLKARYERLLQVLGEAYEVLSYYDKHPLGAKSEMSSRRSKLVKDLAQIQGLKK